ncbi:hypothetical protein I4U23_025541 [Adineta vaga]|nr:hypothetical protein I4U23_025541 [Adineta vaga]
MRLKESSGVYVIDRSVTKRYRSTLGIYVVIISGTFQNDQDGAKSASTKHKKTHRGKRAGTAKHRQPRKTARKGARKTHHSGRKATKSSYNLYIQHAVSQLKASDPNMTHQDAFKKAASQWRTAAENPKNQQH